MYNSPQTSSQARYLMAAYQDCASMLAVARQLDDEDETVFNIAYKGIFMVFFSFQKIVSFSP